MCNNILGIYTITSLHCGTGQAVGAIDQPIARERHTGHPLIPATSIKGRLKEIAFREAGDVKEKKEEATAVFGPDTDKGDEHSGAAVFTDARLLAFPVRSLQAVFYWVTCPMVLQRLKRDMTATKIEQAEGKLPQKTNLPNGKNAVISGDITGNPDIKLLVLEDLCYKGGEVDTGNDIAKAWSEWMKSLIPQAEPNRERIRQHLVILSDTDFTDLVTRTTPVTARIKLNKGTKTTTGEGNLWYEEAIPPDTLFYTLSCPKAAAKLKDMKPMEPPDISKYLNGLPVSPIQIGGNETVGQGWCHFKWAEVQP